VGTVWLSVVSVSHRLADGYSPTELEGIHPVPSETGTGEAGARTVNRLVL